jgi:hypothetical protein
MMNKIPLLEKFAAQSLVYVDTGLSDGKELIFSKEKFAELIVRECVDTAFHRGHPDLEFLLKHFGVEE